VGYFGAVIGDVLRPKHDIETTSGKLPYSTRQKPKVSRIHVPLETGSVAERARLSTIRSERCAGLVRSTVAKQ
jgi:hypothetical protein